MTHLKGQRQQLDHDPFREQCVQSCFQSIGLLGQKALVQNAGAQQFV